MDDALTLNVGEMMKWKLYLPTQRWSGKLVLLTTLGKSLGKWCNDKYALSTCHNRFEHVVQPEPTNPNMYSL